MSPIDVVQSCARELSILGRCTPLNAASERFRLARALERGAAASPKWVYSTHDVGPVRTRLLAAKRALEDGPLGELVARRIEELLVECELVRHVGKPTLGVLARQRFGARGDVAERETKDLALAFTARAPEKRDERLVRSDASCEGSVLTLMRAAVLRLALPFDIEVCETLSALAATGHRTILVAAKRQVPVRVAERTVLHEISGHALPRARARMMPHPIFSIGTAGGHDDQEGWALLLEERSGFLDDERRFELGARHLGTIAMRDGATFVDVARKLRALGMSTETAIIQAERAFRGSDGTRPGLGREAVYLEAFVRVKRHLQRHPRDEALLASGQISVDALPVLRPLAA